jgi:hypothetical protein
MSGHGPLGRYRHRSTNGKTARRASLEL